MSSEAQELRFLSRESIGWERAWGIIAKTYGSTMCRAPGGEVWQYMGSTKTHHEFRHRSLQGRRVYHHVDIEPNDFCDMPGPAMDSDADLGDKRSA